MSLSDLVEGFRALDDAAPAYKRATRYATGSLPEYFTSERIARLLHGSGDAYRFRLSRKPITALTSRVNIASIESSTGDEVNALIQRVRDANDMALHEPAMIDALATLGDAYWAAVPLDDEDREDESLPVALREAGVSITYHSPMNTRAMYAGEDGRDLRYVIRRWQEGTGEDKAWRAEVWYPGEVEAWVCTPGASGMDRESWTLVAEESGPHEYGEPPIYHARTGLPYGRPQHIDAYGPQDAITKAIVTQVEVDLESHGWPERYRLVDDKAVEDTARDSVPWPDNADAPRLPKEPTTSHRRGPGTERVLRATKAVGEYTQPDPGALIAVIDQWIRLMAVASDTPLWEFDPTTGEQMSGVARWRAEAPLRAREKVFKRYLTQFLRDVYGAVCRHLGVDPGQITVTWEPQEVNADPDWWGIARQRGDMGVPTDEILREAGYLPRQVADFLDGQAEDRFWADRVRVLRDLSESLNLLSGPVSLGIVDAAKVSALVDKIMSDAGEPSIGGDGQDMPEVEPE